MYMYKHERTHTSTNTQTHTHTHTERPTSIANEWLGGWEPLPASGKSPNHPKIMCQLSCISSPSFHGDKTAPLHSAYTSSSTSGSQADGPNTRKWHGTATPLVQVLGGWEICLPPSTENIPPFTTSNPQRNATSRVLGRSESPRQKSLRCWFGDRSVWGRRADTAYWGYWCLNYQSKRFARQPEDCSDTLERPQRRSVAYRVTVMKAVLC